MDIYIAGSFNSITAQAGIGVWFSKDNPNSISEKMAADLSPDSNRLLLYAAIRALETAPKDTHVNIHSDSNTLVIGMTIYEHTNRNLQRTLHNADLWIRLLDLMKTRSASTVWTKIRTDSCPLGKQQANRLAILACK